jgi:hypothetical protein
MSATLVVQLLVALVGQLPEIVKLIEELRSSGAQTLTTDQVQRVQAACSQMEGPMKALWVQP